MNGEQLSEPTDTDFMVQALRQRVASLEIELTDAVATLFKMNMHFTKLTKAVGDGLNKSTTEPEQAEGAPVT